MIGLRDEVEQLLGVDAEHREEVVAAHFADPPPANATVEYWMSRGLWHRGQGDYEKAVADLDPSH